MSLHNNNNNRCRPYRTLLRGVVLLAQQAPNAAAVNHPLVLPVQRVEGTVHQVVEVLRVVLRRRRQSVSQTDQDGVTRRA